MKWNGIMNERVLPFAIATFCERLRFGVFKNPALVSATLCVCTALRAAEMGQRRGVIIIFFGQELPFSKMLPKILLL